MKISRLVAPACVCLLSACGSGAFTAVATSDGQVIVVNQLTGSTQRVEAPPKPTAAPTALHTLHENRTLTVKELTQVPFIVSGSARFFEGRLLARVLLVAKAESLNKSGDFARWRSYMEAARSRLTANPSLTLHFVDSRGFVLAKYDAPFREFASIVNEAGESVQYSDQIEVPITPDGYAEVADWDLLWSGWPAWDSPSK